VEAFDPRRLAERQIQIDRERTARFPFLLAHKNARMSVSPLAFLRGSAPLFYELIATTGDAERGSSPTGWIVGDAHLENFGAFRGAPLPGERASHKVTVFGLNDFDEAREGPWRWDVLRLATSLILAGRELGVDGMAVLELSERLIQSHVNSAFEGAPLLPPPAPVASLMAKVAGRSKQELLNDRTSQRGGQRRFVRGARYRDLPREIAELLPGALETYARRLQKDEQRTAGQLEIVDAAFRIAGTGGLGALRVAVLTRGKGGPDGGWILDLKEQLPPSSAFLLDPPLAGAARAEGAARRLLERPPRMLASTELGASSMLVRRLTPQEDKLNLQKLERADLGPLAGHLGALLGMAHARGAPPAERRPWSKTEQSELLARAVALAGLHEATYLDFCLLTRSTPSL